MKARKKLSYPSSIYELTAMKQQLLKNKRDTYDQFMQDLTKTHEKQVKVNQEIHHEINKMKSQVQKVENFLAFLRSLGSHPIQLVFCVNAPEIQSNQKQ